MPEIAHGAAPRKRPRKQPLAQLLVARGLFASLEDARRWTMAGQVYVGGQRADKPGIQVPIDATIVVRGRRQYVSRGGHKLAAALDAFGLDASGRVALDCGASTGGFTDCLVQRGAALVYAVDVGYGQLAGSLRAHPRVRTMERTNLGDLSPAALDPSPTLITLDLSYLSLVDALPIASRLLMPAGDVLALFKPLFEVDDAEARRQGTLSDLHLVAAALRRALDAGAAVGLHPRGAVKLALRPRHGVHECMLWLSRWSAVEAWPYDEASLAAILAGSGVGPEKVPDET